MTSRNYSESVKQKQIIVCLRTNYKLYCYNAVQFRINAKNLPTNLHGTWRRYRLRTPEWKPNKRNNFTEWEWLKFKTLAKLFENWFQCAWYDYVPSKCLCIGLSIYQMFEHAEMWHEWKYWQICWNKFRVICLCCGATRARYITYRLRSEKNWYDNVLAVTEQ